MNTSNPKWYEATKAEEIIATPPESAEGDELLHYCGLLPITQGPVAGGDTRLKDVILPWQERLILWLPSVDEVAIKMGKGSGKSLLLSAIALGHAAKWHFEGSHPRGLIVILAPNVPTGKIIFDHIHLGAIADPNLKPLVKTNVIDRTLSFEGSGIKIQILPPDLSRTVGLRPNILLVDEVHECAKVRSFPEAYDQIVRGGRNNPDFKILSITTAPPGEPGPFYTEWLYKARKVRDAEISNDRFLPALFEYPTTQRPDLNPEDQSAWFFGMPSLITEPDGKGTMDAAALQRELEESLQHSDVDGGSSLGYLLSQRLGIEYDDRAGGSKSVLQDHWPKCAIDLPLQRGSNPSVYAALDPSAGLGDPFALIYLWEFEDRLHCYSQQYLTREAYDRAVPKLKAIYDQAVKAGELHLKDNADQILDAVFAELSAAYQEHNSMVIGGDSAGLADFGNRYAQQDLPRYVSVPQSWKLAASYYFVEGQIHAGKFRHYNQPLLNYNAQNIRLNGNRFDKADATSGGVGNSKIDGFMGLLSAVHLRDEKRNLGAPAVYGMLEV